MKPISSHWADVMAAKIVRERGDKEFYTVASGITPSGRIHLGNFREVITVDLVARALRKLGKQVRFIYSWDNFDTFRKVPKGIPDEEGFVQYLRQPVARIPDPWKQEASFAQGRIALFEKELAMLGIVPEYIYQEQCYAKGRYAEEIRKALEHKDDIRAILDQHRKEPLAESWLPTGIYCSHCKRDTVSDERFEAPWAYSYHCDSCHIDETVDIRETPNLKLGWRVDWPMRWAFEKVDFEPGGKDHSSRGGSFDTGREIVAKVWEREAPLYLQYDFVAIKGGAGKMSSSSGEVFTVAEVLEVYSPEMVRWIFSNQRPNTDFAISFDEDVIKLYDEYDRAEEQALTSKDTSPKTELMRRSYEFSLLDSDKVPAAPLRLPRFRELANQLQICDGDIERTRELFYADLIQTPEARVAFAARAKRAYYWVKQCAPEDYRFTLNREPVAIDLTPSQAAAVHALADLVRSLDLDRVESKELNELIWERVIRKTECDAQEAFTAIYQKLISRVKGPRLPSFLKEVGGARILKLLG